MQEVNRVLELLYDRGEEWFALAELTAAAQIDQQRLEKIFDLLHHRGHAVELSPIHGVRLSEPIRLDAHLIERELAAQRVGRHVICFDEIESTNDVAFDSARQSDADGLAVLAESQRQGRGRMGRNWLSKPRTNILMSVLLMDPAGELPHDALTIAAGIAVAEAIERFELPDARVKWPNDVKIDDGKVAGILVEIHSIARTRAVVIGIGINVNSCPPPEDIDQPATCLSLELGHHVRRIEVVRETLRRLDEWVARVAAGRSEELHEAWLARCTMLNERIAVECGQTRHVGRVLDISPLEGLILECDSGQQVHLPAANSTIVD